MMNLNPLSTRKPRALCVCGCGKVGPIVGRGLRGHCYTREAAAGTLAKWQKMPRNGKRVDPREAAEARMNPVPPVEREPGTLGGDDVPAPQITLNFSGPDGPLWNLLQDEAAKERRTPEQQAWWILEHSLTAPDVTGGRGTWVGDFLRGFAAERGGSVDIKA